MPKETLSQEEIASLLAAASRDEAAVIEQAHTPAAEKTGSKCVETEKTTRNGQEERAVEFPAFLERLANNLSGTFTQLLRAAVRVDVANIDRVAYSEFVLCLDAPTCLATFRANGQEAPFALNIELGILFPMIERMLGGDLSMAATQPRPLTGIEKRLATRIIDAFLGELKADWRQIDALGLVLASVESNPCQAGAHGGREPVARIQFTLSLGPACGTMTLAIAGDVADNYEPGCGDASCRQAPSRDGPSARTVRVAAVLAETTLPAMDVEDLQTGDVIDTEKDTDDLLSVTVDGEPRFLATPGILDGQKAVRIEQPSVDETQ